MKATFEGNNSRVIYVASEGSSGVRLTITQDGTVTGLVVDADTALTLSAAITQAARRAAK